NITLNSQPQNPIHTISFSYFSFSLSFFSLFFFSLFFSLFSLLLSLFFTSAEKKNAESFKNSEILKLFSGAFGFLKGIIFCWDFFRYL
ncbi:hypothetical protein ACMBCN_03310, partial [Candidatus Liberibacter asiaticus]|nr:hypothetical protein [Candidatus Liberibacter asiaticus]